MSNAKKKSKLSDNTIGVNKKAGFEYYIEDDFEAGIQLEGWEVKSLRAGRLQLLDSYVQITRGEAYLWGALITPLPTVSTHYEPDPRRTRKLLLHRREIDRLIGAIDRQGYTIIPLSVYWKDNKIKVKIALAKGKQQHDKRLASKDKDWKRDQARIMRNK